MSAYVVLGLIPALFLCGVSVPMLYGGLRLLAYGHLYESGQFVFFIAWPCACLLGTAASLAVMLGIGTRPRPMRILYSLLLLGGAAAGLSLVLLEHALIVLTIGPVMTAIVLCIRIWHVPRDASRAAATTPEAG
ncbi:MAG: hypothetical protein ACREPX_09830 [Rhodanobacteraceae bacterium]